MKQEGFGGDSFQSLSLNGRSLFGFYMTHAGNGHNAIC